MVIYQEQELQLKKETLGARILSQARNELCLHMRFLDLAFGNLPVRPGKTFIPQERMAVSYILPRRIY